MTRWLIDTASHTFYALILLLALLAGMMASVTPASAQEADEVPIPPVATNPYWSVEDFVDFFCNGVTQFVGINAELGRITPVGDLDMQAWFREEFDLVVKAANVQVVGTPPKNVDCPVFHLP